MTPFERQYIQGVLAEIPHVTWDRYAGSEGTYAAYGWIEREDAYKDFIAVEFDFRGESPYKWFITSSERWSQTFHDLLCPGTEHRPCLRIESAFETLPSVRLSL